MAGINQGTPETAVGEPIRLGSNNEFEIEQHPVSDRLIIRDTQNGKVAYVRKERGGEIGGDGVLIKALKEGKPMADDGRTYDTIQAAERAAGSWVFVPPGTFNEDVNISTDGLTLRGSGYNTLISGVRHSILSDSTENITVSNLSAESTNSHGMYFTDCDGLTMEGVTVRSTGAAGVRVDNSKNLTIVTSNVVTTPNKGFFLNGCSDSIVSSCVVESTDTDDSIAPNASTIVANNIVINCGRNGISLDGDDNIAIGNRVISSSSNGIIIRESDTIVANNRVSDSGASDINDEGTGTVLDANLTGASN